MASRDFSTSPLSASTIEGGFVELATALNALEVAQTDAPNNLQLTVNTDNGTVQINATLPVSFNANADGKLEITPTEYLS